MDFVFILAAALLWGVTALLVAGLARLTPPMNQPAKGQP